MKTIKYMKGKIFWIVAIVVSLLLEACSKNKELNLNDDYTLIEAMISARNQSDEGINIEALEKSIEIYERKGEKGKVCLCDAYIGCKLFFNGNYDKSLIYLKKAEANIQYCDSMASFIYAYIVNNSKATDSILALNYARKALDKDLEYNNLRRLPYSYLNLSLLTKGDSAHYYLQKGLELFNDDKKIMAKAQFGRFHSQELDADTVIEYVKPYYETINYVGYARTLIEAYVKKEMIDSVNEYLQQLSTRRDFENDYYYCKAEILTARGDYEEGCKWWKKAYKRNDEEYYFLLSQRLSAINAEYDLLNVELQNQKEKSRIRGIYIVLLLVLIVVLVVTYTIKERHRKNAHKLKKNVNELEQEVSGLEQEVSGLNQEVSGLEQNVGELEQEVSSLEQEVCDLERDVKKRKERFMVLFEEYKKGYTASWKTLSADAQTNLVELHKAYPELTKTDLTIIWLTFMDCSRDSICELINVSQNYYYQRKSIIQRILGIDVNETESWHKSLDKIVRKYIFVVD